MKSTRRMDPVTGALVITTMVVIVFAAMRFSSERRAGPATPTVTTSSIYSYYATGRLVGPDLAPVTAMVYSDYQCGFCRELFHALEAMRRKYPDHLNVIWKNIDLTASKAALGTILAAHCAADLGTFSDYHAAAFRLPKLAGFHDGWIAIADSAGMRNQNGFPACVRKQTHRRRAEDDLSEFRLLGFSGTPGLVLNKRLIHGALPIEVLDSLIAVELRPRRAETSRR